MLTNGESTSAHQRKSMHRADEAKVLLDTVSELVVDFIASTDRNASSKPISKTLQPADGSSTPTLLDYHPPKDLERLLNFSLPKEGQGIDGIYAAAQHIHNYSVNTWDQGFLDKLYHSPSPVGLAAELLLASLNTNVHTFQVSPALTIIEKETTRVLANKFGFNGLYAGGVSQSGGSAANHTSIVIARNTLFPETKAEGYGDKRFVLFTSEHGHYSLEKAAQISGFGSNAVRSVSVDAHGRMLPHALEAAIEKSKQEGETAFYVNATAGTTVLGSFDPLSDIAEICRRHNIWLHVDASWGGPIIFSEKYRYKLDGIEEADSIAMCPHKMMGVPLSCSVLLGKDLRQFHSAMTLPAGYLFHNNNDKTNVDTGDTERRQNGEHPIDEFWDLADLTPQCGRRGDILKLALSWIYYGTSGYARYIDHGFEMASYLASLIASNAKFSLLSENPPPCLQVCFYFNKQSERGHRERNSRITELTKRELLSRGFMIDYAPGDDGKFFRVVVNGQTRQETMERLVKAIEDAGDGIAM